MRLKTTAQFKRDVRRVRRRGRDLNELWAIVEQLASGKPLDPRRRMHRLSGDWPDCWECHIRPDWLLIWRQERDVLILVRTGTHVDLFD